MSQVESELGFGLPPLLRAIYHEVGNGGFGPGHGILGIKEGKLTDEEYDEIKRHPGESARILAPLDNIKENIDVIYSHHERIDGTGYPNCKTGKKIPLRARIIAVADAFDAMTSNRPYRNAMSNEAAFRELNKQKDTQFDAMIVDAFSNAFNKKAEMSYKEEAIMNF